MTILWKTPAGQLGILTERTAVEIPLEVSSTEGRATFSLHSGSLPRGLKLSTTTSYNGTTFTTTCYISGLPVEVRTITTSKFVIRADDGTNVKDRTFTLEVNGADIPLWLTAEGYLNVGPAKAYFVLDNAYVDFQLEATDTDLTAGDVLEYYISPLGGELPPGLTLTSTGRIYGFTDPIFSVVYGQDPSGSYDASAYDIAPLDINKNTASGYDDYLYDIEDYDYSDASRDPKRLSRSYTFIINVSDGRNDIPRLFKIWVVTEEFLQSDNTIIQVDTNLFTSDASSDRLPLWITESYLGRYRANNYLTIFLDVYRAPGMSGTLVYFLKETNPTDGSASQLPPGMILDQETGEIAGKVPYQSAVTTQYKFTISAVNFLEFAFNSGYTLKGDWDSTVLYYENDAVRFGGYVWIAITANQNRAPSKTSLYWKSSVSISEKTFTVDIIGEIESAINWITDSNLGFIQPNKPSTLVVEAENLLNSNTIIYTLKSGTLPPGLILLHSGEIQGKVKQFADSTGKGMTRFFECSPRDPVTKECLIDSVYTYNTTFDGGDCTFDKIFKFTITAKDVSQIAESDQEFYVKIIDEHNKTFANLYLKAFQEKSKRLEWFNFITDETIFITSDLYRYGDPNFGTQSEIKMLMYAGIESTEAVTYVQAMSRNHYNKRLQFGEVKWAEAKDPDTQETIYEVVYVEIVDSYEKNNKSISRIVDLPDNINSKVLISYDAIKIDSDIPLISDSDHQRIFPNSIKNMRKQIQGVGERDREYLPLWMRSIQDTSRFEPGFVKALVLCYTKPGKAVDTIARIKLNTSISTRGTWSSTITYQINDSIFYKGSYYKSIVDYNINKNPETETRYWVKNFDFKNIDFEADRYQIDVIDGEFADKYLAFPQRGEKLP